MWLQAENARKRRALTEPARSIFIGGLKDIPITTNMNNRYRLLSNTLKAREPYTPVSVSEAVANLSNSQRWLYIKELQLDILCESSVFDCSIACVNRSDCWFVRLRSYRFNYGNDHGNVMWVWRVPSDRDAAQSADCVKECAKNVKIFASRAQLKEWRNRVELLSKGLSAASLRALFTSASGLHIAVENEATKAIDARIQQVLDTGDAELIVDFRSYNGAKKNPKVGHIMVLCNTDCCFVDSVRRVLDCAR